MKIAKMFGLALIAALATSAFVGTGTASAEKFSALCIEEPEKVLQIEPEEVVDKCKEKTSIKEAQLKLTQQGPGVLTSEAGEISCEESSGQADARQVEKGELQQAQVEIKELEFAECTTTISGCSVVEVAPSASEENPWNGSLVWEQQSAPQGQLQLEESKTTVKLLCFGFINVTCVFAGEPGGELNGDVHNPTEESQGKIKFEEEPVELQSGGFLCPEGGKETVTYEVQTKKGLTQEQEEFENKQVWLAKKQ